MNIEEFEKLPIGTVLMWIGTCSEYIEIKTSKDITTLLWTDNMEWDEIYSDEFDHTGEKHNYKITNCDLEDLCIAPKWIQKLFEVLE